MKKWCMTICWCGVSTYWSHLKCCVMERFYLWEKWNAKSSRQNLPLYSDNRAFIFSLTFKCRSTRLRSSVFVKHLYKMKVPNLFSASKGNLQPTVSKILWNNKNYWENVPCMQICIYLHAYENACSTSSAKVNAGIYRKIKIERKNWLWKIKIAFLYRVHLSFLDKHKI